MGEWEPTRLGQVVTRVKRPIAVTELVEVPWAGARWYAEGIYARAVDAANNVKTRTLNRLKLDDITYNRMWATKAAFGVVAQDSAGCLVTGDFPIFVADRTRLRPEYMRLVFQSSKFQKEAAMRAVGTTERRRLKEADFLAMQIALPSPTEQLRIVDVMTAVDQQLDALLEEVDQAGTVLAALRSSLGDLGEKVPLASLAADGGIQIGPFGSQLHAREYTDDPDGIPVVMPQDLVNGEIITAKIKRVPYLVAQRLKRHAMQPGDIVFPRRGDLTKRALVTTGQTGWLCGTGCLRFRAVDQNMAPLLAEAMAGGQTSEWLIEHAVGSTMLNLNTEILSKLPVADVAAHPELAHACTALLESSRSSLNELAHIRAFRSALLTSLLNQEFEIPDSYDRLLLEEVS